MARVLAAIIVLFVWPVVTACMLVVGPIFWVSILTRTLVMFAVMMLLHAIASKPLKASARALEYSIVWFSRFLKNLLVILRRTFTGNVSGGASEDYSADDVEFGKDFWSDLVNGASWLFVNLVPAVIVWVSIYLAFRTFGIDLAAALRDGISPFEIGVWVLGWLFLGLLGLAFIPLVRNFVVLPFVILIMLVWSVVGLVFWIPRMSWAFVEYSYAMLRSAFAGDVDDDLVKIFETGFFSVTSTHGTCFLPQLGHTF